MPTKYGLETVEVEQPGGELVEYLFAEEPPAGDERRAFVLTRPDPDPKTGQAVRYRVALTVTRGWVCGCGDWKHPNRKARRREGGSPCKHQDAVLRRLAGTRGVKAS